MEIGNIYSEGHDFSMCPELRPVAGQDTIERDEEGNEFNCRVTRVYDVAQATSYYTYPTVVEYLVTSRKGE
jgi:hypothetical protein